MSNHTNYTKYFNKENENVEHNDVDVTSCICEASTALANDTFAATPTMKETDETVTLPETIKGTVTNCAKLNIRVKPAIDADIVCVLDNESEVEIDIARSTSDWFKIYTTSGVEGFCMQNYINAKL